MMPALGREKLFLESGGGRSLITAHAGCMGTLANSRESFVAAFSSCADIVEADIRATRDGCPLLMHDDIVRMQDGREGSVGRFDWADIASGRELIMCLEMFLELAAEMIPATCGGRRRILNLDMKEPSSLGAIGEILRAKGLGGSILFSGLDRAGVATARNLVPDFPYLLNADDVMKPGPASESDARQACRAALESGCAGINLEWTRASPRFMEIARGNRLPVLLWTVDKEDEMRKVLALGPDSITTNRPDILGRLMAARLPTVNATFC